MHRGRLCPRPRRLRRWPGPCRPRSGAIRSSGRSGRAAWASSTRRATSGLQRTVAIKTIAADAADASGRQRLWREARTAALINHPNVCQIYDVGEDAGRVFIAMELLDGESLSDRLRRGPLTPQQALPIAIEMLDALVGAPRPRHRPPRPQAVERLPHAARREAAGLRARPAGARRTVETSEGLTRPGILVGTPRYMSPEQATGEPLRCQERPVRGGRDPLRDAGRPSGLRRSDRRGRDPRHTPRAAARVDRLARDHGDRQGSAACPGQAPGGSPTVGRRDARRPPHSAAHRLGARPARRRARADPRRRPALPASCVPTRKLDFLVYSLPDAIATSLSRHPELVVRSSAVAARFADEVPDLNAVAADADVDHAVMGTILRAGDRLRVTAQLVEAPERPAAHVAHRGFVDGRPVRAAGRHLHAHRVRDVAAARRTRHATRRAGRSARLRAVPPGERVRAHLRRPREPRATSTSSASRSTPASLRRGRSWGAVTASSASTSRCRMTARRARSRRSAAPWPSTPG